MFAILLGNFYSNFIIVLNSQIITCITEKPVISFQAKKTDEKTLKV